MLPSALPTRLAICLRVVVAGGGGAGGGGGGGGGGVVVVVVVPFYCNGLVLVACCSWFFHAEFQILCTLIWIWVHGRCLTPSN